MRARAEASGHQAFLEFRKFDGRAVRSGTIGFGPGLPAREQCVLIGQPFGRHQALESRQPVLIVARTVVRLSASGGGLQLLGQGWPPTPSR